MHAISGAMLKAVIFDLDGVVADSHPIHEAAWKTLLLEEGMDCTTLDLEFLYAGRPRTEILRYYLGEIGASEMARLGRRKDELYGIAAHELITKPGILRVLSQLSDEGILCALATSAGRVRSIESLERFGITNYFSVIVTGEQVRSAKPSPEIFRLTAAKLGVEAKFCVVVEDSVAGVQAARAAGMKCAGYTGVDRQAELRRAGADDLIVAFPENAPRYFRKLVVSAGPEMAAAQDSAQPKIG